MMIITAATNNKGKLEEIKDICNQFGIKCRGLAEAGISSDPEETGKTLSENAAIKARAVYEIAKTPTVADDSGLFIDALGGLPGIKSARYAENDLARIERVLSETKGAKNRSAQFRCAICFIDENGEEFIFNGAVSGEIAKAPQGENGFGYDPIFIYECSDGVKRSFAEISAYEKNLISHRAVALGELSKFLGERYADK
ncbi:MAG: RdgB/HAM1 family non-canonical purine NTP pyrophosphatase [Ruminococcus sp.]|jgi:XTP/dITP diphosphohydrolase|nr:RdgB/HAM1 family non-canonical purine NTP pyrophosphatase [Ruminococcus sp.]